MDFDHETIVAFSKSWGLFYLIAFSNRKRFHDAKNKILDRDDVPWQ